jgi:ABC-type lipoprotein release transport system permease subunit
MWRNLKYCCAMIFKMTWQMKKRCYMLTFEFELFSIGIIKLLIGVISSYKVSIDVEEFILWKQIEIQHQWL